MKGSLWTKDRDLIHIYVFKIIQTNAAVAQWLESSRRGRLIMVIRGLFLGLVTPET